MSNTAEKIKLLGMAYDAMALSKVVADWLSHNAVFSDAALLDPTDSDMVSISTILAKKCIELATALDNNCLEGGL